MDPLLLKEVTRLSWERVSVDVFYFERKVEVAIVDRYYGSIDYSEIEKKKQAQVR